MLLVLPVSRFVVLGPWRQFWVVVHNQMMLKSAQLPLFWAAVPMMIKVPRRTFHIGWDDANGTRAVSDPRGRSYDDVCLRRQTGKPFPVGIAC